MSDTDDHTSIRAWLLDVLAETGMKPSPLARSAGLAPSTVLRALDPEKGGALDTRSIQKIVEKFDVAPPPLFSGASGPAPGFSEEAHDLTYAPPPEDAATFYGAPLTPSQGVWTVQSRALELVGYLPGDRVLVDANVRPRPRDVVVAQITDRAGNVETVLRVYDPPYLTTETADPAARSKPDLVDDERVAIWGTVIRAVRVRRS